MEAGNMMQEISELYSANRGANLDLILEEMKWGKTCVIEALAHLHSFEQPKGWLVGALDAMEECERILRGNV